MRGKKSIRIIAAVGLAVVLLAVGFATGRLYDSYRGNVVEQWKAEYEQSFEDPDLVELAKESPDVAQMLERLRNLVPLPSPAPFRLFLDESTGDYVVYKGGEMIASQVTTEDETMITYYGKASHASCDFIYRKGTNELLQAAHFSYGRGGVLGPLKHYYLDSDGDGRFDSFSDHGADKTYELKYE